MINRVVLIGRLTKDLEPKQTQSGISNLRFTVAGRMKEMAGKYCFQISKDMKKNYRFQEDKTA